MSNTVLLKLDKVEKIYGEGEIRVFALRGVDLDMMEGEFTTIYGPSGSGKTTLLNLVGALDKPTSGEVFFEGKSIIKMNKDEQAMHRRDQIGFIFQSNNLIPVLTVYENVEFALKITKKIDGKEAKEKVTSILEKVGLGEMMHRRERRLMIE